MYWNTFFSFHGFVIPTKIPFYRFLFVLSRRTVQYTSSLCHIAAILFPLQFRLDCDRDTHQLPPNLIFFSFLPPNSLIDNTSNHKLWNLALLQTSIQKLSLSHKHILSFIDEDQPYIHLSPSPPII